MVAQSKRGLSIYREGGREDFGAVKEARREQQLVVTLSGARLLTPTSLSMLVLKSVLGLL